MWQPCAMRTGASSGRKRTARLCAWLSVPLLLIAGWMLAGCASGTPPMAVAPSLKPPASLLVACRTLPKATGGALRDLVANHIEVAQQYYDCADRHNELVRLIDERQ